MEDMILEFSYFMPSDYRGYWIYDTMNGYQHRVHENTPVIRVKGTVNGYFQEAMFGIREDVPAVIYCDNSIPWSVINNGITIANRIKKTMTDASEWETTSDGKMSGHIWRDVFDIPRNHHLITDEDTCRISKRSVFNGKKIGVYKTKVYVID